MGFRLEGERTLTITMRAARRLQTRNYRPPYPQRTHTGKELDFFYSISLI